MTYFDDRVLNIIFLGLKLKSMRLNVVTIFFLFWIRMKESRTKKQPEADSEISAWVNKSRKIEKKRAFQLSKIFEEQVFSTFISHLEYVL